MNTAKTGQYSPPCGGSQLDRKRSRPYKLNGSESFENTKLSSDLTIHAGEQFCAKRATFVNFNAMKGYAAANTPSPIHTYIICVCVGGAFDLRVSKEFPRARQRTDDSYAS